MHILSLHWRLEQITKEQFEPAILTSDKPSIVAVDAESIPSKEVETRLTWGVGPYIEHRLFNPDLPLSWETGVEVEAGYQIANGLKVINACAQTT